MKDLRPGISLLASTLVGLLAPFGLPATASSAQTSDTAASPQLLPIPFPDLAGLEEAVARQLQEMRDQVEALGAATGPRQLGQAYGELGRHYQTYELEEAAEAAYKNAVLLYPYDASWPYYLGYLYQKAGRLEEAADYYALTLIVRPNSLPALVHLAEVYLARSRPEMAEPLLRKVLAENPESAVAHALLGELALGRRQYEAAVESLLAALAQVPEANRLHYPLAMAYRGLGDQDKAREHLEKRGVVGIRAPDPLIEQLQELRQGELAHLLRGRLAFNAGRIEEAAEEFRQAVAAQPQSGRARVNLGTALGRLGDSAGAIAEFRQAVEIEPKNATAHFNLGSLLADGGSVFEAVHHLEVATTLDPKDKQAQLELAAALERLKRHAEAQGHYRRAMEIDPTETEAWLGEARMLVALGNHTDARARLDEAHAVMPEDGLIAHALARLLAASPTLSVRDGQRSLELATAVFKARPSTNTAQTVAMALAELGRCEEAAQWQQRALDAVVQAGQDALAPTLKQTLDGYAAGPPCRYGIFP